MPSIPMISIVDDDEAHAQAVAESLERVGYECTVVSSGNAGARKLEQDDFDVILTDLKMADLDGLVSRTILKVALAFALLLLLAAGLAMAVMRAAVRQSRSPAQH